MLTTNNPDAITILLAANNAPVRKSYSLGTDGAIHENAYPLNRTWKIRTVKATDHLTLLESLRKVEKAHKAVAISGTPAKPFGPETVVVRKYLGDDAPFIGSPKRWVAFDIDDLVVPLGTDTEMAAHALDRFPAPFSQASCVYQWSAKQALPGRERNKLRIRLWFLLDEEVPPMHWRSYARTLHALKVDPALYNPVQPHYTSAPAFGSGIPDPFRGQSRFGLIERGGRVNLASIRALLVDPKEAKCVSSEKVSGNEAQIQTTLERVVNQKTGGARHHHCLGVACELLAIGCDDARILEAVDEVIIRQGREPQENEAENALIYAKQRRDSGTLQSKTRPLNELLDQADEAEDKAWSKIEDKTFADGGEDDEDEFFVDEPIVYDIEATPIYNAHVFLKRNHPDNGFVHWAGTDLEWTGRHWQELESEKTLKFRIVKDSGIGAFKSGEIAETLRGARLVERISLGQRMSNPNEEIGSLFSFQNGQLLLDDYLLDPHAPLKPHDKDLFVLRNLGFKYDPEAGCPQWERFLDDCFLHDSESRRELQKMFGYILSGSLTHQKIFVLQGPTRAGKGVVTRTLSRLLGAGSTASKSLADFGDDFFWQACWDKSVLFINEANREGLPRGAGAHIANELKMVSGCDLRNIRRKMKPDLEDMVISARVIMSCNRMPAFLDPSDALFARLHVLRFRQSFYGKEDYELEKRLASESAGIFNWALEGCRILLLEDGRFKLPKFSENFLEVVKESMAPAASFTDSAVELDAAGEVKAADLYAIYRNWAAENGQHPIPRNLLDLEIMARFPTITSIKKAHARWFRGLSLTKYGAELLKAQTFAEEE